MSCYLCDDCQNELGEAIARAEATAVSGAIQRIDRDKLAEVIQSVLDRWFDGYCGGHGVIADAVLDALPELMGGGER